MSAGCVQMEQSSMTQRKLEEQNTQLEEQLASADSMYAMLQQVLKCSSTHVECTLSKST